ncbi:hypothetical protein ACLX1H_003630 [Fusarium chlamydosporum]
MWLSRGLLASTLILAVKAQDGIEDAAMRIASGFAETLIQHAVTTLSGDAGGAGDTGDTVNAGDQGNQGNQGQAFDASLIDAATVTHTVDGQPIVETYTSPGGHLFPVTLLPHPRITIAPSSGDPYERIIQAYTGGADATTNQEITIAEPTGTKPGTVIVDVPGSAYSSFSSGQAGALTIPPSNDHPTATVISALPSGVAITGEATRTIPAAGGASATVVIQTPWADVPPSTPGVGAGVGGGAGGAGGAGGNVGGSTSNVLVISTYTGTEVITQARVTTIAGSGGDQGTVVVQVPPGNQNPGGAVTIPPSGDSHFTTIVSQYTGAVPISTPVTRLVPTSGTNDGTIIIETPGPSSPTGSSGNQGADSPDNQPQVIPPNGDSPYSTILRPHAGSDEITTPVTYTIPPSGTNPGTVIIETPAVRAGQSIITLPSDPGSGYITIVRQATGTGIITAPTTITIPPSNGQPGTIVIETPAPQPGSGEITIPAGSDGSFITVIRGPTGTGAVNVPTTITITGAAGQPGTVIIETPVGSGGQTTRGPGDPFTITNGPGGQYVTVFRPHSGDPISVPITLTQPGQNGQPGTIVIETPDPTTSAPGSGPITIPAGGGSSYVTVYRPHSGSPISQPITITVPPTGGLPGTIIVETPFETPKGQNAVTSSDGSGGQQITIPPSKNNPYVTIYRPHTGDPITVPITITQSPSNGQPGTIIIETPAPPAQTVTEVETAPGATVTVQPSTPGGYTTVYRPHTGDPISEPITVTTISGSNGQPGTVIIETQGPITITASGSGGTATIFTPGTGSSTTVTKAVVSTAPGGQPTTVVVIETPPPVKVQPTSQSLVTGPDGLVTVTEEYTGTGVITAIFTTTVIASGTGPGTVYIETPPPIKFNPTTSAAETTTTGNDGYVTVFKPFPGPGIITAPITITEAAPSNGQPGTVVVQTPVGQNPTTPLPQPSTTQGADGYVTVFLPFPGPGVITQSYTRTQAPSGGNPGTVFITTPAPLPATTTPLPEPSTTQGQDGYVTVYLPFPGPGVITQPYTRTQAPSGGNPGTVFITTPAPVPQTTPQQNLPSTTSGTDGYVTVFIPYPGPGEITAPITSTQPPSGGMPGTVFITTPVPAFSTPKQANGLTSTSSGVDGYVTVFVPFPGPGEITAPITSTQPPSGGMPGTVFITTPAPAFSTPKQANGLTSTSSGSDGYVTVFIPYPGPGVITAPITSTQAPVNGQPGTVFVTTPAPLGTSTQQNVVTSTATGTDGYVTVFIPYPGPGVITAPITSTQAPANGQPGTVFVTTPAPLDTPKQQNGLTSTSTGTDGYVTVFIPFLGPGAITAPITSTQPPANGQPGTVYITTPAPISTPLREATSTSAGTDGYITVFLPFPGPGVITAPITSTQPPSGGNPGTVYITTPAPLTSQQGAPSTGQGSGDYITVFLPYPGPGVITAPITSTKPPSDGNPGTVFITTPAVGTPTQSQTSALTTDDYLTIYTPFPGPGVITSPITITKPPSDGHPGTVLIQTPAPISSNADTYVTVYRPYPGPGTIAAPITLTQAPANGQPGTVFIETQPTNEPTPTTTSADSASPITIPPAPTGPYVTIFRPYPGPGQISSPVTYTQAPVSGQPGTVIIETPNSDAPTATKTGPVTVPTGNNNPYVTVYRPYPGPGNIDQPITITSVTASGDQPGTIIIETPTPEVNTKFAPTPTTSPPVTIPVDDNNYVTVYRPHTGSPITAPITVTTIAPTGGQPGTVIIETPGPETQPQSQAGSQSASTDSPPVTIPQGQDGYVTVYQPYPGPGTITEPITVSTVAPSNGQPGTVIIQTPAPASASTTASADEPTTSASAVTIPANDGGYVTVYRPYPGPGTITAPRTVGTVAAGSGRPGTIIIETPAPQATADETSSAADITTQGNDGYVTVFQPYTGTGVISGPITVSSIPPSNGQPGTVFVQTAVAQTPTSTETGGNAPVTIPPGPDNTYVTVYRPHTGADNITAPVTVTTIQGVNGQPGTIVIETPVAQTPTSTEQSTGAPVTIPPSPDNTYLTVYRPHTGTDSITAPVTVTTIEGVNGQPGTIIIETPNPMAQTPTSTDVDTRESLTVPAGLGGSYTTIYRPYTGSETIATPLTSTIEGTNGQPGTVVIETPKQMNQGASSTDDGTGASLTVPPGPGGSYTTVYRPYTGTETIITPLTSTIEGTNGQPGTIIIETPTQMNQSASSTGDGTGASLTVPPVPGSSYTTVYRPYTGTEAITAPVTSTIEGTNGQPGTVIIETPTVSDSNAPTTVPPGPGSSYTTVYRPYTGTNTITAPITTTVEGTNGQPGTVIIETPTLIPSDNNAPTTVPPGPDSPYVTVYRPYTGTETITAPLTTTIQGVNGQPGTVIIETPTAADTGAKAPTTIRPGSDSSYTTIYRPYTGTETIAAPITSTIQGENGQLGTVIVETPTAAGPGADAPTTVAPGPDSTYSTIYRPYTGTESITAPLTSIIQGVNGQPGTVIIETPTEAGPGANAPSTAPAGPDSTYMTVYEPYPGPGKIDQPITVTTIEPSNGNPGTVIIQTPGIETGGKAVIPPVTVDPSPGGQYVTVYRPHTGTDIITAPVTITTIAPAGGQPGTVIVETPEPETPGPNPTVTLPPGPNESYVTVFQPHTGTDVITGPVVVTTIAPANGQPGTVIIETPVASEPASTPVPASSPISDAPQVTATYATVYRPHTGPERITAPITITTIEPSGDQPGTVIIETPDQELPPVTTSAGPAASYVTVYQPHTGNDRITEPITITTIEPANGQPGTVIVETPGQQAPPVTSTPAPVSYITITKPFTGTGEAGEPTTTTVPPQGDQPGTVIVETAEKGRFESSTSALPSYVTISRPYTGTDQITAPIVTTVPPQGGQPGTVIYETQAPFVTVYRPHTGPDQITGPVTVSTIAPTGEQPGTIIVETPGAAPAVTTTPPAPSYVTITNPYTGMEMLTEPTTVTTIPPHGDQPGTVIVETQGAYATISTLYTGTGVITGPVPVTTIPPQGNQPGTVVMGTLGSYTTVYTLYTGTDSITGPTPITTIRPQGDQPGTVIIATPASYITTSIPYTGLDQITAPITTTIPPLGDQPGTVVVQTQVPFATIYRPHTGPDRITAPVTVSTIAPIGDEPGTIIVETPGSEPPVTTTPPAPSYTSVYQEYSGTDVMTEPRAVTTIEPQGDQPGTIIFDTPAIRVASSSAARASYVTVYQPHTGPGTITESVTVTTVPPQGNQPGTVIIETPGSQPAIASAPTPESSYVTVYQPHTGPGSITEPVTVTTIAPQGGEPGTVVIETPGSEPPVTSSPDAEPSYATIYQPHSGSDEITAPVTISTIEPQGGQPGTIIIETPGSKAAVTSGPGVEPSYVTVYRPHSGVDQITAPVTITSIEPQGDQPGTVIIETPGSQPPITSGAGPEPSIEPQGDQPGTVIVETPGSEAPSTATPEPTPSPQPSYVTIYQPHTGADQITAPVTITTVQPQGDQPGTVIIETPGSQPPVTSGPGLASEPSYATVFRPHTGTDSITAPVTVTTIQPQGDQPGTVIVETPGSDEPVTSLPPRYTTIYKPHSGTGSFTGEVTRTIASPQGDQPGTVIVETPGPEESARYTTIYEPHSGTGKITGEVTRTVASPQDDQPGTVIVETPGADEFTRYSTIYEPHSGTGRFTGEVTKTVATPQGDQPGTVVIETPGTEQPAGSYNTIYEPHSGTSKFTGEVTKTVATPQGDQPGTVVIETPGTEESAGSYTTIYEPHTGTGEFTGEVTRTIASPQGGQPGTVVVETPGPQTGNKGANPPLTIPAGDDSYVTVLRPYTGTPQITAPVTVTTIAPSNGQPGTVIIETPVPETAASSDSGSPPVTVPAGDDQYVTIFRPHTGTGAITAPVTVTTISPSGGQPGTVIIETPEPATVASSTTAAPEDVFVTIFRPYTGAEQITGPVTVTTIAPVSGTGTVIIETLAPKTASDVYVTIYRPYTGTEQITAPTTVTTIAPVSGTGTVIVETPTPEPTVDSQPSTSPAITIPSTDEGRNVTVIRPYPGPGSVTAPVTKYMPPTAAGEPGTVVIETPVEEPTTEAKPQSQATTAPAVTIPPSDGSPNITVVRQYPGPGVITAPVTSYEPPSTPGHPGTVIIETPAPVPNTMSGPVETMSGPAGNNVTFYTLAPPGVKTPITSYAPPQTPGQDGTVFIQTVASEPGMSAADERNVTITTEGPASLKDPHTRYEPPGTPGDPGTVFVETPGPAGPATQGGENVTITTQGPESLTAPITRFQPPGTPGDPGTVVVETPGSAGSGSQSEHNITVMTQGPATLVAPITRFQPPGTPGDAGTVIIETPGSAGQDKQNVTIMTQGTGSLTAPSTRYEPPGTPGDPGTVFIETPGPTSNEEQKITITREGPSAFTTYSPPGTPGDPGTVIIETPPAQSAGTTSDAAITIPAHSGSPNVTVIRGGPGKEASTIYVPPTGTEPGTIIIETPTDAPATSDVKLTSDGQTTSGQPAVTLPPSSSSPNVTVIQPYPGPGSITEPVTRYVPPTASGEPGTVIIETQTSDTPAPTSVNPEITLPPSSQSPNVTVIRPYPGPGSITEPTTRYVPPTAAGEPGTIIIETQATESSNEAPKTATEKQATSEPPGITIPANSGNPNVTVFRPYTGPGTIETPITSYIAPANSGEPGTVVIETPAVQSESSAQSKAESTSGPNSVSAVPTTDAAGSMTPVLPVSSNANALTLTPSDSRDDFTIIEPNTKFAGATENVTQIVAPSDGSPGTKIIYTPVDTAGESSLGPSDTDTYVTISATVTIPGDPSTRTGAKSNAGSDVGTTGAETNVIIIPPSGTEPGTVLSQTSVYLDQGLAQHGNVTITRAAASGVTTPFTTYSPPAQSSDKGTIIVEVPDYNITTTRTGSPGATRTLTTYSPPASPGEPGLVIVETPDGTNNVTITRAAPASVTSLRTTYAPPGTSGDPGTVIVETPNNEYNVTITRGASVTVPFTTYSPPGSSGDPGTVIVETPDYNVTVTTEAPASITDVRTKYVPPASAGDPGTVFVETPNNAFNVTVTRAASGSVTRMFTTYAPPGTPGDPGTVFVETPNYNVTVTRGASVTSPFTTYSPPATPGDPGTVIVETPDYNVTLTTEAPKTVTTLRSTYISPGKAGDPGTVIIETPIGPYNVTTTRGASITAPLTTYSPPGSPGDPGTVIIETPDYNVTVTSQGPKTATAVFSTYLPPGKAGDPGTVIVETPADAYNVTTTRGASTITALFTTYSPPGSPGDPGTVIVETPDYNVTITSQGPKTATAVLSTYLPPGKAGDPGTVIIETPISPYNITTTRGDASITATLTTYLPPGQPGDPGTVLVETPEYNVTVTGTATDSVSDTVTRYNPPASEGDPGTVAIIMPNQKAASTSPNPSDADGPGQNVTVYRPGPRTLTGPVTSYVPPASRGGNGTVIIETPGPATAFNITTTQTVSTITAIYTTYLSAGAQNDPGTILVEVPPSRNVTVTEEDATITAPYTSYSPPGADGDPGTVIIGMPADRNVTITSIVSTQTAPYTSYLPPANRGDPGTVVIQLPPDSNVTTTKTVSDRTAPYTTYSGPANRGDPGTVIIEVPPGRNVTVTQIDSSITSPYTSYSSPAQPGDPGTVFIGMHPDSNVTITTEVASRTAPYTTYSSPANQGDPGTVIVEIPPSRNTTITTEVASRTKPFTTYISPANKADPGTVLVEMPPDSNITITTEVATRTKPYTTFATPANKGDPGTVIVEMPPDSNVTITTQVAGLTAPYTSYASPGSKGDPGTVVVGMPPDRNVTITTEVAGLSAPYTSYASPDSKGDPGTVIIAMPPDRNVTLTTQVSGLSTPYTSYAPPRSQGDPGTIVIGMPPDRNVTITTEVPTRTAPYTTYSAPGARGDPGTIIIEMPPDRNVTITTEVASLTAPYTTYSAPGSQGDPGTIIIGVPPDRNVTTTEMVPTLTMAYTTYSPPENRADPGTVIVRLPRDRNVTSTTVVSALTAASTVYSAPANRGDPGTIIIELPPDRNVTTTEVVNTITRATTTYASPANQGDPGTVIVQEPPETNTTIVEVIPTITRPATRFVPPGTQGDPGTVYIDVPPNHNVTITTTVSTITRPTTTFVPPATEGDAGTVFVEMPPEYNVTKTQTVQTISRPATRYSSPAEVGDPGTVYLDMPPEYNVTVTTTIYSLTRQSTTFAPAATQGDPGTVIIEMPPAYNVTTTETVQTITRPTTRYSTPGEIGDPGTIYVDLPPQYNVTITTTVPTITRQSTTFAPAAEQGDPGTIIIEMPPDTNVTTTQTVSTISRPTTRYSKPGTAGDPGTVYVDLPPEYNVTVTSTVATITRVATKFASADQQGDAGTIIIQMPPDTNVTTTETISTISRPTTRYSKPGTVGDPGTIYVDLPPEYNVTSTTTIATITRASTTFASAGEQGDPGTVIVQLPPDSNVTISSVVPTITRPATRFATPATAGDPGTVFLDLPPEYNVTTTQTISTISRATTTYNPAGEEGDPGTIIVQVPPEYNVTTTETVSSISRVRTTYNPAGTQGDPNTVLVQVPPDYNVTTTQTASDITRVRTTYISAATQGDPGTVLVQVPPDYNVTTTQTISTISRVRTTYQPAGTQGDPNTVFVQVPVDYNVTTTETVSTISHARTTYNPGATQGDPGTVLVQLPPNVTTTSTDATVLQVFTTFIYASNDGDPGTVLVELPGVELAPSGGLPSGTQLSAPSAGLPSGSLSAPTAGAPSAGLPSASLPSGTQLSAPSAGLPSASLPSASLPSGTQLSAPSVGLPSASLPSSTQLSAPSVGLPSASLPTVPAVSMPSTTVPAVSVPSTTVPAVSVPSTTIPTLSVSSVAIPPAPISSSSSTVQAPAPVSTSTSSKMPQASFGPTFDCDSTGTYGYTISTLLGNTLTKVNLVNGARTVIKSGIGPGGVLLNLAGTSGAINSIGFNPLDYYIYGFVNQGLVSGVLCGLLGCPKSQLVRIASNGAYELLPLTIPSNMLDMGDVDDQGRLWVSESGAKWWCVDLNPKSANFGKLINSGQSTTNLLSGVGDWAYVPGGGDYLYAVQASVIESGLMRTNIVRWSRTTHVWERYQTYPNLLLTSLNLVWGAVMAGPGGTLYAQENLLGQTWKFTLGSTANPVQIPGGSIANLQGDGARCIALDSANPIPTAQPTTVTLTVTVPLLPIVMTSLALPGLLGDPATLYINVPPKSTVTTTQTISTLTKPTTVIVTATSLGVPDTVFVQYPPITTVTVTTAGPTNLASLYTTTLSPGQLGAPATVLVQIPPVTITTNGGTSISVPYTTYSPPGASGDPGTVVIATPAPRPTVTYTSAGPQFSCDVYGYLMQKTALYRVDITSGKTTLIKSNVGAGGWINGIGYNRYDNYIYGMYQDDTGTQLIRIGGDGTSTMLTARTNDRNINMGDIDNQGRYWISNSGGAWWTIDLMPGSAKYGQIIMSGTATTSLKAADWAFVPGGGDYMYAVMFDSNGVGSTLCRFSRTTYTWQTLKSYGSVAGSNFWGAVYASADGSLYGSENNSGQIFQFPVAPTIGNPKFIATGPVSSWNDGARCIDSQTL